MLNYRHYKKEEQNTHLLWVLQIDFAKDIFLSIVPEYQPIANPDGLPMLYKSEQKALTDWLAKQGIKLTNSKSRMSIRDRMAFANGQSKGNGIGIDTQVNDKTKARLLTWTLN